MKRGLPIDPVVLVDAVRFMLTDAGSPAYIVAVCRDGDRPELSPMVFSRREPAQDHAEVLARDAGGVVLLVARAEEDGRAEFSVYDASMTRVHRQLEVVETSLAEDGFGGLV